MYLTRFRVNTARRDAARLLSSPHRVHGAVNMAFPELPIRNGEGPRVLWRLDQDHAARTHLYIVSPTRPDLTHLVEQAGWSAADSPGWTTFAYQDFLDALAEGDTYAFRLTANPVHYIRNKPDVATKRTAHVTARHQMRWLLDRQERGGFDILRRKDVGDDADTHQLVVRGHRILHFGRAAGSIDREKVRIAQVTFEGQLMVSDVAALRRTLTQGLGKARAYGCGLMTLVPVQTM